MEKIWGVVAEFNPFHNGHQALLESARSGGASHIVAVMSGNFVQRGDLAVVDKWTRTRCALELGADLVLELPLAHACAPARRFGLGAVHLLRATGLVEGLLFGSECGDAATLQRLAELVESPPVRERLGAHLSRGNTFARARQLAVAEVDPALAGLLATANNNLALEYLRGAAELGWSPRVFTVARVGAAHDAPAPEGGVASASYLRGLGTDFGAMAAFLPRESLALLQAAEAEGRFPARREALERAVLAALRGLTGRQLAALPDLSEGLENRLAAAVRQAGSLAELEAALKTKRYTLARVRRLILCAFLGITRQDTEVLPPYLRVLGFGPRGEALVRRMKRTARLPVDAQLARLRELGGACRRAAELEARSGDLYALSLPVPRACGWEYTAGGVFLKGLR